MFRVLALNLSSPASFPWGREGPQVVELIAMKHMTAEAQFSHGICPDCFEKFARPEWRSSEPGFSGEVKLTPSVVRGSSQH
jgi:hypothetical protein